jgi:hypothetical protein
MTAKNGMTTSEMMVLRDWGHNFAVSGKHDGLNTLMNVQGSGSSDRTANKAIFQEFLLNDIIDDNSVNGSSQRRGFHDLLRRLTGETRQQVTFQGMRNQAIQFANRNGITRDQITRGFNFALNNVTAIIQNHPVVAAAGAAGLAGAMGTCPFLTGTGVAVAAAGMGMNAMMKGADSSSPPQPF